MEEQKIISILRTLTALLTFLTLNVNCLPLQVIYHEQAPFIFKSPTNGEITGIIPQFFNEVSRRCMVAQASMAEYKVNLTEEKFRSAYTENVPYGSADLPGIDGNEAAWIPMLFLHQLNDGTTFQRTNTRPETLTTSQAMSVLTKRSQIAFMYKLWLGIQSCQHILVIGGILLIFFAILTWVAEWLGNEEISRSFIFGGFQCIWLAIVTMTTVGYGDLTPRSVAGRFIIAIWMITGLIIASLLTATVSEALTGIDHISMENDKVGVLKGSRELIEIRKNYPNTSPKEYTSYEDVLAAIRSDAVEIGVINSEVAAWLQERMNIGQTENDQLVIVEEIDIGVPLVISLPMVTQGPANFTECMSEVREAKMEEINSLYKRKIHVKTIYVEPMKDFFEHNDVILYSSIAVAGLLVAGLIFEITWRCVTLCQRRKHRKQNGKLENGDVPMTVYQNGNAKSNNGNAKSNSDNNNSDLPKNASKLEVEITKLRNDIRVVKEQITKISVMAQYKQKCTVCEWNS